ncbi:hypothetical protein [Bacteroides sp. 51]|uniref:hypothetical protein n=1 Tax=Bacteroides sp. 51 TaxID=2302938 RepID=UPI0013D1D2C9|nr:hypothetical protein [Bacteroides sp. 51]NDV82925.1 hypothetical protein [Bacteroides sp. 51]
MNKMKEEIETPRGNSEWMITVARRQQRTIEEAERILEDVLQMGISSVDIEYREEICYDIEGLDGYYSPGILRDFRHFFSLLYYANNPKMYPNLVAHVSYLLVVVGQIKEFLKLRIEGAELDITSMVESHIGFWWKNINLLEYKMYEKGAEIIQLSFNSTKDTEKMTFTDKGYWFNLKTGKIHYVCKIRPAKVVRFIKGNDTEPEVVKPKLMFVYPGEINSRIRWKEAKKRKVKSSDIKTLLGNAETDYAVVVNRMKESFKDPLAEPTPAVLIKLHKAFINGGHLVLEDGQGGLLTVMDLPEDNAPTSELLRAILPANPEGYALLVEVNEDIQSNLFSVKPLSIITSNRIIRLLY